MPFAQIPIDPKTIAESPQWLIYLFATMLVFLLTMIGILLKAVLATNSEYAKTMPALVSEMRQLNEGQLKLMQVAQEVSSNQESIAKQLESACQYQQHGRK